MRRTGAITGFLALGSFVIPGSYLPKPDAASIDAFVAGGTRGAMEPVPAGSATIAGRIYGPDGEPLAGAEVTLAGSGFWPARSIHSGPDGRFSWVGIPSGIYELRAAKAPLAAPPVEGLILDSGTHRTFALQLVEGWTLSGHVRDALDDRAIAGATVHVAGGPLGVLTRSTTSDARGRFTLAGIFEDALGVYVDAPGFVPVGPIFVSSKDSSILLRLEPGASIRGEVVDPSGRPIANAVVRAYGARLPMITSFGIDSLGVTTGPVPPIVEGGPPQLAFTEEVSTRADGTFELSALRSGAYAVIASHEGYAPTESAELELSAGAEPSRVRLVLRPGFDLRGRIVDRFGSGLEAIPVELQIPTERLPRMTLSDADGAFAFAGVRGTVTLRALPYDLQPASATLSVERALDAPVELVLSETLATLRGRVVDEAGFGIDGALVSVIPNEARADFPRTAKSAGDGSFAVPALPKPPYRVHVDHPAYGAVTLGGVEQDRDLQVVLATAVALEGRVVDEWSNEGLAGVAVTLEGPTTLTTKSGGRGTFGFPRIPMGTYEIAFRHPDYQARSDRIVVAPPLYAERPQTLPTVRLLRGGSVEGEVYDSYGEPVPAAEVTWGEPPRWGRAVKTDTRGRFRLRGVTPGAVWLTARHRDAGQNASPSPVTVYARETSQGAYVRLPERLALEE